MNYCHLLSASDAECERLERRVARWTRANGRWLIPIGKLLFWVIFAVVNGFYLLVMLNDILQSLALFVVEPWFLLLPLLFLVLGLGFSYEDWRFLLGRTR